MKCQYCGYNLGLDDEKCPHCGEINTQAASHIATMKDYKEEFDKTTESVAGKKKISERTARLIVIGVMVAICMVMLGLIKRYSDFDAREKDNNKRIEDTVTKNQAELDEKIKSLEKNREYLELEYNMLEYRLRSNEHYSEYDRVFTAAINYEVIYNDIINIVFGYDYTGEKTNKDWCSDIAIYVSQWDLYVEGEFWGDLPDSPRHSGEHGAFIADCKKDIQDLIQVYFGLMDSQAEAMWDMEEEDIAEMLYSKCMDLYPEAER